jgi:hypothetical protein
VFEDLKGEEEATAEEATVEEEVDPPSPHHLLLPSLPPLPSAVQLPLPPAHPCPEA